MLNTLTPLAPFKVPQQVSVLRHLPLASNIFLLNIMNYHNITFLNNYTQTIPVISISSSAAIKSTLNVNTLPFADHSVGRSSCLFTNTLKP